MIWKEVKPVLVNGTGVEHAFICGVSSIVLLLGCFLLLIKALHEPGVHWFKRCLSATPKHLKF